MSDQSPAIVGQVIPAPSRPYPPKPFGPPKIPCLAVNPAPLQIVPLLNLSQGRYTIAIEEPAIRGLVEPFADRARVVLLALLDGCTVRMAAARAGIALNTVDRWRKEHPEFAQAESTAKEWGFATTQEAELHHIAMDRTHRGQVRALELVTKSRAPEYREKQQLEISVVQRAQQAVADLGSGWTDESTQPPVSP